MKRALFVTAVLIGFATGSTAATLTVVSDESSYIVGDIVTLTIIGTPQGAQDSEIYGRIEYSAGSMSTLSSSQTRHTWGGGAQPAILGTLNYGDGFADVFNQIIDFEGTPRTVDQEQIATVVLVADAVGPVIVSWSSTPGLELDFFGLDQFNFPIVATGFVVPEPASMTLQIACLVVLVAMRLSR